MDICSICNKEYSNYQGQKCPICGKFICFHCAEDDCTHIHLEDYQWQFICNNCITKTLKRRIDKAECTQAVMNTAQDNHYNACEAITNEILKLKEKHNESKTYSSNV